MVFLPWAPIQDLQGNRAVHQLSQKYGATPHQIVLAWLLARSPAQLPIPGTGSVKHLEANIAAAAIKLTPEEVTAVSGG
jgi:aryl-alcohol dehydrogenase-like predicted oxidoreductase